MSDLEPPFTDWKDVIKYLLHWQKGIYVREEIDGKWGAYSLYELPEEKKIYHIVRFAVENISPVRLEEYVEDDLVKRKVN